LLFGRGQFCLHKETLTFKVLTTMKAKAIYFIGVNKHPSKFDTLLTTSLFVVQQFNGLPEQCFSGYFGYKELNGTTCIACVSVVHVLES